MTTAPQVTMGDKPREFVADHTGDRMKRPIIDGPNKAKFAMFGANVTTASGAWSRSRAPQCRT